jgi:hypothetical protein
MWLSRPRRPLDASIDAVDRRAWAKAATFVMQLGGRVSFHELDLRVVGVKESDSQDGKNGAAEIVLHARSEGARQAMLRESQETQYGDYKVKLLSVEPSATTFGRYAPLEARIAVEWAGEGLPPKPFDELAAEWRTEVTREIARGGRIEFAGLRIGAVRIEENDPDDPDDDIIELSLVTRTQSSQLTLRELDAIFFEDYEIEAMSVNPVRPPPGRPLPDGFRGGGSAVLRIRILGKKPTPMPAGRPIG